MTQPMTHLRHPSVSSPSLHNDTDPGKRFLSRDECRAIYERLRACITRGDLELAIDSKWTGTHRFSSNIIRTSRDVRNNDVEVSRNIDDASYRLGGNQIDDASLRAMVRRGERYLQMSSEVGESMLSHRLRGAPEITERHGHTLPPAELARQRQALSILANDEESMTSPTLFFESTYSMDEEKRAAAIEPLVAPAKRAGLLAGGSIEVIAVGSAFFSTRGSSLYNPMTRASYSMTVRSPDGSASGWAGVDWNDWDRIDPSHLANIALDKCLRSKNRVRVEPGRYTVILEPQAVWDLCKDVIMLDSEWVTTMSIKHQQRHPDGMDFTPGSGTARFHEQLFDPCVKISQDPMDPDCGFNPFSGGEAGHAVTWIDGGALVETPYDRQYAIQRLHQNTGLLNGPAHRMHGGTTTVDEMIATSKRAIVVTRLSNVTLLDKNSWLLQGYTRDGTWLVENGTITKSIMNLKFTESPNFVLANIEQIGPTQRVFSVNDGAAGAVVPPLKVRDFSFTALTDSV